MSKNELSVGDTVELKPETVIGAIPEDRDDNQMAKIQCFLSDVEGGFKTDRDLRGCRYWNIKDVQMPANQAS